VLPDAFINAGGVTVSYFEWLKNLEHVRFGRMEKRFDEQSARNLLAAVEKATGRAFSDQELNQVARGAEEIDLVNSGLEETMIEAYHGIREIQKRGDGAYDLRAASMIDAIDKVALAYKDRGIFP
jgi:glutamate dehydrogenase (NAD(P)+)